MGKARNGFTGLTLLLNLAVLDAQPPETELKIEIHIYNYSSISDETMVRAEQESARIFQHIGVGAIWRVYPLTSQEAVRNRACALPDVPTRLTLRLLTNSMADRVLRGGTQNNFIDFHVRRLFNGGQHGASNRIGRNGDLLV
jgi:hypothetical protein